MESYYAQTPSKAYTEAQINSMLASSSVDDIVDGFFITVAHSKDYDRSENLLLHFIDDEDKMLKMSAIILLGYLAKARGKINFNAFHPYLEAIINVPRPTNFEDLEKSLLNIWVFCRSPEVLTLDSSTTIGRFYNTLKMCDAFEVGKKFKEGIEEFERLKEKETNTSVSFILKQSIVYLTNNLVGSN